MTGGSSATGGAAGSSAGGAGSSAAGGGGSPGGSSAIGGVTGSLGAGGASVGGASVGDASVGGADGSLVVAGRELSLGGAEDPLGADGSLGAEGSSEDGEVGVLLGVGRTAGKGTDEALPGMASCAALRPAPTTPSRTLRTVFCTVSLLPSISAAACSSTCSTAPGRTWSTSCSGTGVSESGASQVSKETTTTAAATTPAPANNDPRLAGRPRRSRKAFRRGKAGAFSPRPSLRISFCTTFNTVEPASPSRRRRRPG